MTTSRGVVKKDMVRPAGTRQLGGAVSAAVAASQAACAAGGGAPAARIVEQSDRGAVVEVTCACGRKTLLHCAYTPPGAAAPPQPVAPAGPDE